MQTSSYGTWPSPISADWVTAAQKRFTNIIIDGEDIYWDEMRPSENGRTALMRRTKDGAIEEAVLPSFSVRTRVHEYGGGAFTAKASKVYFVNDRDQRIYAGDKPLTAAGVRFADLHVAEEFLIAVGEQGHENFLVAIDLATGSFDKMATGHDFYASPALSPDGKKLAFLTWDHPNMPWDGTDLWVADYSSGKITNIQHVAGSKTESIFEPQWSPEGDLYFVSDRTGWWNIYKNNQPICPMEADFGLPQWVFGMSTYGFTGIEILALYQKQGQGNIALLPPLRPLTLGKTFYTQLRVGKNFAAFICGSPSESKMVVRLDLTTQKLEILAHNLVPHIDPTNFSHPEVLAYPSASGRTAYGYFYPPANKEHTAPVGELPPLLIFTHGGPTASTSSSLDLGIQYWTSRGFAVLDVDYGGSTGYGRAYRDALKGNWGIVDIEDCEYGAKFLTDQKKVDPNKIAIRGGSAGGYTTLAALTFGKRFTVGASYYGVSDLSALAEQTHKFESHYLESLVAPYPARKDIYKARSPLFSVDKLHCPVIFFQGTEDLVVPVNQAQMMYDALHNRGILTELVLYEGEQHGFRRAENIRDALQKELAFYLKAWGIAR
ncbi:MAG: S9 family peptidase [Verrucomicrobia bacterium]|nr:S9 family peptidase [Verrucomicrobiota bacterium]